MPKTLDNPLFDDVIEYVKQEFLPAVVAPPPPAGTPAARQRTSKKRLQRELEAKTAEKLPGVLDAALNKALLLINGGDEKSATRLIAVVFEAAGLKQRTGVTVNVQQNNSNTGNGAGFRSFDAIVRRRAQAQQQAQVIDVTAERG